MREVLLNERELNFCRRVGDRRERAALGWALQDGRDPFPRHPGIDFGTPAGDARIEEEKRIHFLGVAGELAFCKAFDIYYPNRLRDAQWNYEKDDVEWRGDPKDADVADNIEVRSVGISAQFVCIKSNDNPSFNVVVVRRLTDDASSLRVLGFYPVREAKTPDRKSDDWWCQGYKLLLSQLRPINDLPFGQGTLGSSDAVQRDKMYWNRDSPYMGFDVVPWCDRPRHR